MDPSSPNTNIQFVHGEGMFFSMVTDDGSGTPATMLTVDSDTFMRMSPGEFLVQAASITMKGSVLLGSQPIGAIPLIPAAGTQATPSVFFSVT